VKLTIVINGAGGVGKDTMCEFAAEEYAVTNVSSIDPVKQAARILGWDAQKDLKSRKFLADMKQLCVEYNDWPTKYLVAKHEEFLCGSDEIMFVHIREGKEIAHFVESVGGDAITLLVRRSSNDVVYGNSSDDDVENYNYDYIYNNDRPLDEAKADFIGFLSQILQERSGK